MKSGLGLKNNDTPPVVLLSINSFKTDKSADTDTTIGDVPWYRSCRVLMAFISAWGYVCFYILRIDLSMAIVCMVRDPNITSYMTDSPHVTGVSDVTTTFTSLLEYNVSRGTEDKCLGGKFGSKYYTGELEWDKSIRGYVLSSFFYGYMVTQVPGGWMAARWGGKRVYGWGVLVTIVATLLVPVGARVSPYILILLRVIMGLACGVGFPATHHLYGKWIPPNERSRLVSFSHAGTFIGTIIALFLSGILCDTGIDNGWPLIFYVYGAVTFGWWLLWHFFVFSSPDEHPRIDPVEREFIKQAIWRTEENANDHTYTPWAAILKSPPVWAAVVGHTCNNWTNYTILICIPMYMQEVLRFDIKQNGALSALPYILCYITTLISGQVADFFISRKIFSVKITRKIFQGLSTSIPAVLIVLMGLMDCERRNLAVLLLCATLVVNSLGRVGYGVNHLDLSPRYAGILFGISNTLATVPGMVAPTIVGFLTPNGTREEWMKVFLICCGFFSFSTIFFAVFADGAEQPWSNPVIPGQNKPESTILDQEKLGQNSCKSASEDQSATYIAGQDNSLSNSTAVTPELNRFPLGQSNAGFVPCSLHACNGDGYQGNEVSNGGRLSMVEQ